MLSGKELQGIANLVDPDNATNFKAPEHEIDINHLDYKYVETCTDREEISKLLEHLKTGKDGFFPDLELAMMKRMEVLDPSIRVTPYSEQEIYNVKKEIDEELKDWLKEIEHQYKKLPFQPCTDTTSVRGKPSPVTTKPTLEAKQIPNSRITSTDYKSWDKLDVEKELENIDQSNQLTSPAQINTTEPIIEIPSNLTHLERVQFALDEKNKGNECIKSKEYEQSYYHYSMSIKLNPTVACLNNRALASLKLKKYQQAIDDTTESLKFEKGYKAYLRRALAEFHTGKYQEATIDVNACLEITKTKEALDLKKMVLEKWMDVDGTIINQSAKTKKNRMKIVEIDEESEVDLDIFPKKCDLNSKIKSNQEKLAAKKKVENVIDYDFDSSKGSKITEIESDEEKMVVVVSNDVKFIDVDDEDDSDSDGSVKEVAKLDSKGDSKLKYSFNDSDDD